LDSLTVYTDGACLGNPGPGGWAWATTSGKEDSGGEALTTNQRMELTAVIRALEQLKAKEITVVSDSNYVINCFKEGWWVKWIENGWKNANKKPVKNDDLWKELIYQVNDVNGRNVKWLWVKGHSMDKMNDYVDLLAKKEAEKFRVGLI
jgi:ribonuclease HI